MELTEETIKILVAEVWREGRELEKEPVNLDGGDDQGPGGPSLAGKASPAINVQDMEGGVSRIEAVQAKVNMEAFSSDRRLAPVRTVR